MKTGGVGRPRKLLQQAGMYQGKRKQLAKDQSFSETVSLKLSKSHRRNTECEQFQGLIFWGAFVFIDFVNVLSYKMYKIKLCCFAAAFGYRLTLFLVQDKYLRVGKMNWSVCVHQL